MSFLSLSLPIIDVERFHAEFEEIKVSKQIFNEDYIVYLLIKILSLLSIIAVTMDKRNDRKYWLYLVATVWKVLFLQFLCMLLLKNFTSVSWFYV